MRNGDFLPSRFDAQIDAAHLICNTKRQSNVENSVALMSMSGSSPQVLVTLTSEQGKLQHAIASAAFNGHQTCNLVSALQVAQLILKNRQNTNQRQRIVVFIGSPLEEASTEQLVNVGKQLRKNGVSLDVITLLGSLQLDIISRLLAATAGLDEQVALKNIHEALLDPNCTSHLLVESTGGNISQDLKTSPILAGEEGASMGFGMDDEMDPELAMALKLSLEEEEERQRKAAGGLNEEDDNNMKVDKETMAEPSPQPMDYDGVEDEEAMLAKAIALSMETAAQEQATANKDNNNTQ